MQNKCSYENKTTRNIRWNRLFTQTYTYTPTHTTKGMLRFMNIQQTGTIIVKRSLPKSFLKGIRLKHTEIDVKEVSIPVPWGTIAARHWMGSDTSRKPVLCIHGWKDNAATWDRLMPLLIPEVPDYQFLAIDLPGHGQSSHFPPGMIYGIQDVWVLIERLRRLYNWSKINIMGHSMGAQISFLYSGTHPNVVEQFVAIDALSPVVLSRTQTIEMIPQLSKEILTFEDKLATRSPPIYTYDEIVSKLMEKHTGKLDPESCKTLMTRGITETPAGSGKYRFSHDLRVQYMPITGISSRQVSFVAKNFESDILHIKAIDGVNYTKPFIKTRMEKWLATNPDHLVQFVEVEGAHHVHLVNPQMVLPFIAAFLKREKRTSKSSDDAEAIAVADF